MNQQAAKAAAFRDLHARARPFLIPNPWDRGSALILESMGFEALATTSLGLANMLGQRDVTLQQVLASGFHSVKALTGPADQVRHDSQWQ